MRHNSRSRGSEFRARRFTARAGCAATTSFLRERLALLHCRRFPSLRSGGATTCRDDAHARSLGSANRRRQSRRARGRRALPHAATISKARASREVILGCRRAQSRSCCSWASAGGAPCFKGVAFEHALRGVGGSAGSFAGAAHIQSEAPITRTMNSKSLGRVLWVAMLAHRQDHRDRLNQGGIFPARVQIAHHDTSFTCALSAEMAAGDESVVGMNVFVWHCVRFARRGRYIERPVCGDRDEAN